MTRLAYIPNRIIDHNGIADGAVVHVYLSGTTTPILLYSDSSMTVPMANPFTVAAGAAFPAVYYDSSVNIKLTIVSALDDSIEEYDPYSPLSVNVNSPFVSLKTFGAIGDGVANDYAALQVALLYLKANSVNPSSGGAYNKGSPRLYAPAGQYYFGTNTIDIDFGLIIEGDGSGRYGPNGGAGTEFRWDHGCTGLRFQFAQTSGNTTVDITTHDGAPYPTLVGVKIEGGYAGVEGEFHGIVCRTVTNMQDVYIHNWSGDGLVGRAGNQTGGGTRGGNFSESSLIGVKAEGCRIGFDIRGGDANGVRCWGLTPYQNRQAGIVDDNGAGSNTYIGCHTASNGLITGAIPTQCTFGGNHYAAKWGGDFTVAPSGTTADSANWLYIEAGTADSTRPAHTATPNTFRAGGDYVTLNSASAYFINCYSEYGGFSQFTPTTYVSEGTIGTQYYRGGTRTLASSVGYVIHPAGGTLNLVPAYGSSEAMYAGMDGSTSIPFSYVDMIQGLGNLHLGLLGHYFYTGTYSSKTLAVTIADTGVNVAAGLGYYVNGTKVVGTRGAAVNDAAALTSVDGTNAAAAPTQAEFNALVAEFNKLRTDLGATRTQLNTALARLRAHGLIA